MSTVGETTCLDNLAWACVELPKGDFFQRWFRNCKKKFQNSISDIAAGHNFSVAVTSSGLVYSFGHSEYNQHGNGGYAGRDYTDPYFYFIPQPVSVIKKGSNDVPAHIVSVKSGSNFTIAIDIDGNAYSWGYPEYGVLGHGIGHFTSTPKRIEALGVGTDSKAVLMLAAGSKHAIALSSSASSKVASNFRYLIDKGTYADVEIFADDGNASSSMKPIKCHKFMFACRSPYLRGYLLAAQSSQDASSESLGEFDDSNEGESGRMLQIDLTGVPHANAITISGLLDYIYLDKLNVPDHKLGVMAQFAEYLCLSHLKEMILLKLHTSITESTGTSYSRSYEKLKALKTPPLSLSSTSVITSSFSPDMRSAMTSSLFADVSFTLLGCNIETRVLLAHKAILTQCEYFAALFSSSFRETQSVDMSSNKDEAVLHLSLDGLQEEGISFTTFNTLVEYAYTGELKYTSTIEEAGGIDLNEVVALLVAANRLGFSRLAVRCERELVDNLKYSSPESIRNCLVFARIYDFVRLERACLETLRLLNITEEEN